MQSVRSFSRRPIAHITTPSIQPHASFGIAREEIVTNTGRWCQLRVFRDGFPREHIEAEFDSFGPSVVTDTPISRWTNAASNKGSNSAGDAIILATGSHVAGILPTWS